MLKTNKVRADTTVVPANVAYPTDSGLLAKGVAKMAKAVETLQAMGLATRTTMADRTRIVRSPSPLHRCQPAPAHRRGERRGHGHQLRASPRIASTASHEADAVARMPGGRSRLGTPHRDVLGASPTTSRSPPSGRRRSPRRPPTHRPAACPTGRPALVSLHDPDARPIRKGRLGKPVEFGYKAQLVDNEDGVVLDHNVEIGNPPDAPMLAPAVERVTAGPASAHGGDRRPRLWRDRSRGGAQRARRPLRRAPDQGQTERDTTSGRETTGVPGVVQVEDGKRRTDQLPQARLRVDRTCIDGLEGARTWCGHGVFNHNLVKIAALMANG